MLSSFLGGHVHIKSNFTLIAAADKFVMVWLALEWATGYICIANSYAHSQAGFWYLNLRRIILQLAANGDYSYGCDCYTYMYLDSGRPTSI